MVPFPGTFQRAVPFPLRVLTMIRKARSTLRLEAEAHDDKSNSAYRAGVGSARNTKVQEVAMWKYSTIVPLSVALILSMGVYAEAASHCDAVVAGRINQLNIDMDDIRSIFYTRQIRSRGDDDRVVGIFAWVNFHSCKGSMVIDMDVRCHVRKVYTRHECRVPGVRHW